jgi:hypothetical protein
LAWRLIRRHVANFFGATVLGTHSICLAGAGSGKRRRSLSDCLDSQHASYVFFAVVDHVRNDLVLVFFEHSREAFEVLDYPGLLDVETLQITPQEDIAADALGQGTQISGEVRVGPLSVPYEERHSGPLRCYTLVAYHDGRQLRPRWSLTEMRELDLSGPCEKGKAETAAGRA